MLDERFCFILDSRPRAAGLLGPFQPIFVERFPASCRVLCACCAVQSTWDVLPSEWCRVPWPFSVAQRPLVPHGCVCVAVVVVVVVVVPGARSGAPDEESLGPLPARGQTETWLRLCAREATWTMMCGDDGAFHPGRRLTPADLVLFTTSAPRVHGPRELRNRSGLAWRHARPSSQASPAHLGRSAGQMNLFAAHARAAGKGRKSRAT